MKPEPGQAGQAADRPGRPVVAVFDLDRTITRYGTYTPFLFFVARRYPLRLLYTGPLLLAAGAYKLGLISRKRLKEYMLSAVLGGSPRAEVDGHAAGFIARCTASGIRPGARRAIAEHKAKGDYLILATASLDLYVNRFGAYFGFDAVVATRTLWGTSGHLSGQIDGENCMGDEKLRRLESELSAKRGDQFVVAYSDSHVDLPMLRWADRAVAVNPSRRLRKLALNEGYEIVDWN